MPQESRINLAIIIALLLTLKLAALYMLLAAMTYEAWHVGFSVLITTGVLALWVYCRIEATERQDTFINYRARD